MPSSPGKKIKAKDYSYKSQSRFCEVCGEAVTIRNTRDLTRKRFCSGACRGKAAALAKSLEEKVCKVCSKVFLTKCTTGLFCSKDCANVQYTRNSYSRMNNSPEEYFKHALYKKGREALTVDFMLNLLETQGGLCAITRQKLTFLKVPGSGRVNTNASIDQIKAGGGYTEDNVQIVCDVVNRMKIDMDQKELEFWCQAILEG